MDNLRRIPTGLIGAMAMIMIAELGVFRGFAETTPFIPASWRESGNAARREAVGVGVEVLGFGDSQVKCGLQPGRLGRSTFNLAVVGGQAASSYYLLERALEAGARPKAVVVDFFPSLLASDCRINTRQWAEMLDLDECLDLLWTTRDTRLLGPMLAQWLLPSLRMRSDLRAVIVARLLDEPEPKSEEGRAYRRNWRVNLGAHVLAENPGFVDGIEPGGPPGAGDRWRPKAEHLAYVRRFLALAEAHQISVFWLMPTTAPGARAVRVRDGREGAYVRFVRSMMAEYPGLTVIDPSKVLAGRSGSFHDVFHLDRRGAVALSEAVGVVIEKSLSQSGGSGRERWVELDDGGGQARGAIASKGLEDIGQSAERVRVVR
jgi:hypothetical protein